MSDGDCWLYGVLVGFVVGMVVAVTFTYHIPTKGERVRTETAVARALCVERGGEWVSDPEGCYTLTPVPMDDPETEVGR